MSRLKRVMPVSFPDRLNPLPLRSQLFLVAHDDDTGRCHLDERSLAAGLAGAVLLELWLARRVQIGWWFNARTGDYTADPGRINILDSTPVGDALTDSALVMIWHTGGTMYANEFIARFASTSLYQRVRADMIAAGLLTHVTARKFFLFRTESYQQVHSEHSVRARYKIRQLADTYHENHPGKPDPRIVALTALVTALGLTKRLYPPNTTTSRLHECLHHLINQQADPTIQNTIAVLATRRATTTIRHR